MDNVNMPITNIPVANTSIQKKVINRRTKTIIICCVTFAILLVVFLAGIFMSENLIATNFENKNLSPSLQHPFGTDWMGRDMFARTIKGLSLSIMVGVIASTASAIMATLIGIAAAMGSKKLDSFINWCIDLVMSIPHTVLLILISFALGRGLKGILVGIVVTHWTSLARLIRSEVMQIRSQQYILVSRKMGHSNGWILRKHILPHVIPQFVVGLILLFPHAILHESSLTFLGYGLSPEQPAIGIILSESMKYLSTGMWWLAFFPGLLLVLIVLLFDVLGDNLKMLIDPYCANE